MPAFCSLPLTSGLKLSSILYWARVIRVLTFERGENRDRHFQSWFVLFADTCGKEDAGKKKKKTISNKERL
jgi:hypothetical protein